MKKKAPRRVVKKKSGPIKITPEMVARARHKPQAEQVNWFAPAQHPKSVMPDNTSGMAQDDSLSQSIAWAQGSIVGAFMEGQAFLGYPYLSLLAQRPEYRRSSEVIANHMTRKWIKLQSSGDADKTDRIKELNDELTRLKVRELFKEAAELDGFFGRSHLFIDLGDSKDSVELKTSIGTGAIDDKTSPTKVAKSKLKKIKSVEAVWCYPSNYNSDDPLSDSWYKPQNWYVQSREIHATRLLTFVGREVPDLLKPAYSFGGLSLSQMMKPYVDNWLQTRQSVSDLVQAFATMVLSTNLPDQINANSGEQLFQRIDFFNSMRKNRGTMAIDKETEDLKNVTTPLGSLDKLQAQAQEHMCLQAGTLITTDRGQIAIEAVTTKDLVLTRAGLSHIRWVGVTGHADTLIEIKAGCETIRVTEEHPVWSESINEFVLAQNVSPSHCLLALGNQANTGSQSLGAADGGGVRRHAITETRKPAVSSIARFGRYIAEKFQKASNFIIETMTAPTTISIISKLLPGLNTCESMAVSALSFQGRTRSDARSAVSISPRHRLSLSTALHHAIPQHVKFDTDGFAVARTSSNASAAGNSSPRNANGSLDSALRHACSVQVTSVEKIKVPLQSVYNIEVDGDPEFFANGLLVHNSSVNGIPLIFYLGITPSGLNATSEGEIEAFDDWINSNQESFFRPNLTTVINLAQLSLWGKVDPDIGFVFEPLRSMTDLERAKLEKDEADTDNTYIDAGVLAPDEVRKNLAANPDSRYNSIDLSKEVKLPPPPEQEDGKKIGKPP